MIRSQRQYDQTAHDQPTQATPWAAESGDSRAAGLGDTNAGADYAMDEFERRSDRRQSDKMNGLIEPAVVHSSGFMPHAAHAYTGPVEDLKAPTSERMPQSSAEMTEHQQAQPLGDSSGIRNAVRDLGYRVQR